MARMRWCGCGFAIIALLLAACGGSSDEPTATAEPTATQVSSNPVDVQVTLSDTTSEMKIESSIDAFTVGVPYHFVVTNTGAIPHELMIIEPMATGRMSMAEMDELALAVVDEDDLEPGATYTFDLTFTEDYPPGTLEFACHIPGHYESGMHMPVTVSSS